MTAPLRLSAESLRDVALHQGVCIRPVMHEVYDTVTKSTQLIPTPCGATREQQVPAVRAEEPPAADAAVPRGLAPGPGA